MKSYIDRLRELPTARLEQMTKWQEDAIGMAQRDLERLKRVLSERENAKEDNDG